jgi:hypothetical protein
MRGGSEGLVERRNSTVNDRVILFVAWHGILLARMLTDRGAEYCGNPEHHVV